MGGILFQGLKKSKEFILVNPLPHKHLKWNFIVGTRERRIKDKQA